MFGIAGSGIGKNDHFMERANFQRIKTVADAEPPWPLNLEFPRDSLTFDRL